MSGTNGDQPTSSTIRGIAVAVFIGGLALVAIYVNPILFENVGKSIQLGSAALGFGVATIGAVKAAGAGTGTRGFAWQGEGGVSLALVGAGATMVLASALAG